MKELSIVIPAYNEADRIIPALTALKSAVVDSLPQNSVEVIVVCDGCTDTTSSIVRRWGESYSWLSVLSYQPNHGKGYALRKGIAESQGRVVMFMDADGATPPGEILRLLPLVRGGMTDIVIGSRRVPGAVLQPPPSLYRRFFGRSFTIIIHAWLGLPYRDTQCGFKIFDGDRARRLFSLARSEGYAIDVEILLLAQKAGIPVREEAIEWHCIPGSKVKPVVHGWSMLRTIARVKKDIKSRFL
jgi:glycosyltransferase involved in cell wall biosynthesis